VNVLHIQHIVTKV